ncbi:MAG TPA: AMP-binding protein [Mycobacteriales bacterium]|nr:AMP-binding protein [Mycobacteriales bacterium]
MSSLPALSGRSPDDMAVEDGVRRLTWTELDARSLAVAHGLAALGAGPGSHVAICVGNRAEFVEVVLGAWRAGCAYTPLKTGWTPDEVGVVLDDAGTSVLVADREAALAAASARGVPVVDLAASYESWLERQDTAVIDDLCGYKLPFTSGTTGRPKGVVMSGSGSTPFSAGWAGIARYAEQLCLPGDGVHLFGSRLFNGAPQTFGFGALARGATLRVMRRWDPAEALVELADPAVTSTIMVPTMFRQLLALPGVDRATSPAPGLRALLHGGEPCPVPVKQAIADWFGDVLVEYYGFTEGGMTVVRPGEWQSRPGTVGRPLPGLHVEVRGGDGAPLPTGAEGTVYFRVDGGRRFRYSGDEAKTESAHVGDAFTVGDVGRLDDEGFLYLCGRAADVVISAGVNIYPAEIENALSGVAGVADLCAVGVADDERGEVVALHVVLADDALLPVVLDELSAAAERRLAPYKRPREIVVADELPRDATGKLLRRVLRDAQGPSRKS